MIDSMCTHVISAVAAVSLMGSRTVLSLGLWVCLPEAGQCPPQLSA